MKALLFGMGLAAIAGLVGCGGGSGGSGIPATSPPAARAGVSDIRVTVTDVAGAPIGGAVVSVTVDGSTKEASTNDKGVATIADVRRGAYTLGVRAAGFESISTQAESTTRDVSWGLSLNAEGAWAIGRALVLHSRVADLAPDGSAMTFEVDVAVVDADSQPIETLTAAEFSLMQVDCGWGGPGDCAADAERRATGSGGQYMVNGAAESFGLQPAGTRVPYVVGVLVERSADEGAIWAVAAPALKAFFAALGGNDTASLMSVQAEGVASTFHSYGPFTSGGATFFDAIDGLADAAGDSPAMAEAVAEAIRRTAAADAFGLPDVERHVLVVGRQGLTAAETTAAAELASSLGVRISKINQIWSGWYGISELAARTQGVIGDVDDSRQYALIFGALDSVLGGTVPFYRMQFRLTGAAGTFVAGGNVKLNLVVDVPSPLPNRGFDSQFDVAIP